MGPLMFATALQRAFAEIPVLIVVAQFDGFVLPGRSAAGNGRAANAAVGEKNFRFDGWISARIENFDTTHSDNC